MGELERVDIIGNRKKERLANDLKKMHGQSSTDMISRNLEKIDSRALTNLNEDGYQAFLNGISKNMNL
jgi:hypothetical protein